MAKPKKTFLVEVVETTETGKLVNKYRCEFSGKLAAEKYANSILVAYTGEPDKKFSLPKSSRAINRKQFNQLRSCISLLPSKNLLKNAKTEDSKRVWACLNWQAKYLSKCLATRLLRQDGDPIRHLLFETKADKLIYQVIWGEVEQYEALLSIIQLAWEPISQRLNYFGYAPKNGFHLLLNIIAQNFDETFIKYLEQDFKISPSQSEKLFNAAAKLLYRQQVPLTEREEKNISSHLVKPSWIGLILDACEKDIEITQNPILISKIEEFINKTGILADYAAQLFRHERKNGSEVFIWENQMSLSM